MHIAAPSERDLMVGITELDASSAISGGGFTCAARLLGRGVKLLIVCTASRVAPAGVCTGVVVEHAGTCRGPIRNSSSISLSGGRRPSE
jgi:hypothetical protein